MASRRRRRVSRAIVPTAVAGNARGARAGLRKIVRRKTVTCTPSGQGETVTFSHVRYRRNQRRRGGTRAKRQRVRDELFFNSLSSEEDEARNAKAGIWQGEVARPQEWREHAWADAKRDAPDGCPIKELVRASSKQYELPWFADYGRAKVRTERGERWFCSEDEAKAAGFQPSDQS